jgi:hypothetical protein
MLQAAPKLSDRACVAILILYLCLIYPPWVRSNLVAQIDYIKGDAHYYQAAIISLLQDGDLLLANQVPVDLLNGQLALGREGLVPKHPMLLSLVSLPFYQAFGSRGLLIFNIMNSVILVLLIFQLNRQFFDSLISLITTTLYATATLFYNYVYNYSPDVLSTVLVLAGLNSVLRGRYYWGAVNLGFAVFAKLPNLPLAGIILIYAGAMILRGDDSHLAVSSNLHKRLTRLAALAILFFVSLLPFGLLNQRLFGSPVVTGYQRTAVRGTAGEPVVSDHVDKFNQPFLSGSFRLLFDPDSGVVTTNPILLLAFLGFLRMNRSVHPGPLSLVLAVCVVQFLTFAKYDDWQSSEFSNRFLMTFVAGSSVFTSGYLQFLGKRFFPTLTDDERSAP